MAAPCNGPQGNVCCAWHHLFHNGMFFVWLYWLYDLLSTIFGRKQERFVPITLSTLFSPVLENEVPPPGDWKPLNFHDSCQLKITKNLFPCLFTELLIYFTCHFLLQWRQSDIGCLRGTVVERWSLTGELSLSCARPAADGWPLMWVNRPR